MAAKRRGRRVENAFRVRRTGWLTRRRRLARGPETLSAARRYATKFLRGSLLTRYKLQEIERNVFAWPCAGQYTRHPTARGCRKSRRNSLVIASNRLEAGARSMVRLSRR